MFYLDTGTIPVEFAVTSGRVNYLHKIIKMDSTELVSHVYAVQTQQLSKGDWCSMVKENIEFVKLNRTPVTGAKMKKKTGEAKFKSDVKQNKTC